MNKIKEEILNNLIKFDNELNINDIHGIKLIIFGSSSIVLKFNPKEFRFTKDIDLLAINEDNKLTTFTKKVNDIANKFKINTKCFSLINYYFELNNDEIEKYEIDGVNLKSIEIYLASAEFLVSLKIIASTERAIRDDLDDISLPEVVNLIDFNKLKLMMDDFVDAYVPNNEKTRKWIYFAYEEYLERVNKIKKTN